MTNAANDAPPLAPAAAEGPADAGPRVPARWSRARRVVLELLFVGAVFLALRAWQTRSLRGGAVPPLTRVTLDGTTSTLGGPRARPQLVWFFARWCGVCRTMEHNVRAVAQDHDVLAIATDSGDDDAVRAFVSAQGLRAPRLRVVNDRDGALARRFGVRAFPTSFVLRADGAIGPTEVGYTSELGLRARLLYAR